MSSIFPIAFYYVCITVVAVVAPLITTDPLSQNVTLLEGNITLTCEAVGLPIPTIEWLHNGSVATNGQVFRDMFSTENRIISNLIVTMAMVNDSGDYLCQASSIVESSSSAEARVLVQSEWHSTIDWLYSGLFTLLFKVYIISNIIICMYC